MWGQIVAWPNWDYAFKVGGFVASIATIIAIYFLIKQIKTGNEQTKLAQSALSLGTEQLKLARSSLEVGVQQMDVARSSLEEDRAERKRQEESHRDTILIALQTEIEAVRKAAEQDLKEFDLQDRSLPRALNAFSGYEPGYKRSFVWTPLPMTMVEQAMREAHLLGLNPDQLESLQNLRLELLRANSQAAAKISVLAALASGGKQHMQAWETERWSDMEANSINSVMRYEAGEIIKDCTNIARWLKPLDDAKG